MLDQWWAHSIFHSLGAAALAFWIFWVLFSITLHELGHGWAAIRQGDRTPILLNRMTFNPLVHMGAWSLIMFAVIGICWGMMPVDPSRFKGGRKSEAIVAAAGPAMNTGLAIICFIGLLAWLRWAPPDAAWHEFGLDFFRLGCGLNVVLLLFNLLPVPPLDGSTILAGFS